MKINHSTQHFVIFYASVPFCSHCKVSLIVDVTHRCHFISLYTACVGCKSTVSLHCSHQALKIISLFYSAPYATKLYEVACGWAAWVTDEHPSWTMTLTFWKSINLMCNYYNCHYSISIPWDSCPHNESMMPSSAIFHSEICQDIKSVVGFFFRQVLIIQELKTNCT